ncbi:MAG: shikimate kinase [Deltaproteobacteria bacterium]
MSVSAHFPASQKVFLIGYRGTGKTQTGRILARFLGRPFIDLDDYICEHEGASIKDMVERNGWPYFRNLEREALQEMCDAEGPLVVACGGGAVLHEDLLERITAAYPVVWLTARKETIVERVLSDERSAGSRPALTNASSLADEVERVISERRPLYERFAWFSVATDNVTPEEAARLMAEGLEKGVRRIHGR